MVRSIFTFVLATLASACSTYDIGGIFDAGSSVQERFDQAMSPVGKAFHPDVIRLEEEQYSFLLATDLHIRKQDQERVEALLAAASGTESGMLVTLGDYLHTAGSSLAPLAAKISSYPGIQFLPAIGNHEVYKDGYQKSYFQVFGPTSYALRVETPSASDLLIVLDSANGTLGRDQTAWLEALLAEERDASRHCMVFTHANFFAPPSYADIISTYPLEEQMHLLDMFARNRVTAVFTGHSHVRDLTTVRGVRYITLEAWNRGEYARVNCPPDAEPDVQFLRDAGF